MKTQLITIATIIVIVFGLGNNTFAAANNNNNTAVVLTDISKINKIEVYGNVELYVSNGPADQVKVYNRYYAESALVQSSKGVLRISSYKAEKLVVWVTANELTGITAYDNAQVKSFGNLSSIELDVKLYNNATAKLKLDTYSAYITLNGNASAELSGTVNEYSLTRNRTSNVNSNGLTATHATETFNNDNKPRNPEYAGL